MFLMCHKSPWILKVKRQQGSALVVALFIIIVMGLLVGSMSRLLVISSESISYEVLGTRAFFAAQSGMERSLSLLYVLDAPVLTSCPSTPDIDFGAVGIAGLEQCRVTTSCTAAASSLDTSITHFYLVSTATCGTGIFTSSRTIEMEVWQ